MLSVQFRGIKYTCLVVQPSSLPISRNLSLPQTETLYLLNMEMDFYLVCVYVFLLKYS